MGSKYDHLQLRVPLKLKPGEAYIGVKGVDFYCEPESFRGVVYQQAAKFGQGFKGTAVVIRETVIFKFYRASDYMRPNLPAYPIVKKLRGE